MNIPQEIKRTARAKRGLGWLKQFEKEWGGGQAKDGVATVRTSEHSNSDAKPRTRCGPGRGISDIFCLNRLVGVNLDQGARLVGA